MNKTAWKIGHVLSRRGLIDAACQMRDIAQIWGAEGCAGEAEAMKVLDRLHFEDEFIDEETWRALTDELLTKGRQ